MLLGVLVEALIHQGRVREARSATAEAQELVESSGERLNDAELRRLRARQLVPGDPTAAERELLTALDVARTQGARGWQLRVATDLAELRYRNGNGAGARDVLEPSLSWFSEGSDTADLVRARTILETL